MDFVAVVDQAIALLSQWGRLTYRILQGITLHRNTSPTRE
jgi:hypothetical protein